MIKIAANQEFSIYSLAKLKSALLKTESDVKDKIMKLDQADNSEIEKLDVFLKTLSLFKSIVEEFRVK